jgi:DNA-binding transcriptional LysR family regulator
MDLDIRLLRSFVTIYEKGSLARAAERLNCTPAALSMRLKLLETEIGSPLFLRNPAGLDPTTRGSELYARALGVLSVYDEMISRTRSRPQRQRIRIGLPDDYAIGWLGKALAGFSGGFDDAEFEIVCDLSANLVARAQRQEIDLALVTIAARPSFVLAEANVPLRWVGSTTDSIALSCYPEGCVFRREMVHALDAADRQWRVAVQSASHAGVMGAVRSGLAVTAVAAGTAPHGLEEHVSTALLPELPEVPLYLVGQARPRPEVERFAAALTSVIAAFDPIRADPEPAIP